MGDLLVYPKKGAVFGKLLTCSGIQVFVPGLRHYPTFWVRLKVSVAVPQEFCLSESDFTGRRFPVSFYIMPLLQSLGGAVGCAVGCSPTVTLL